MIVSVIDGGSGSFFLLDLALMLALALVVVLELDLVDRADTSPFSLSPALPDELLVRVSLQ